MKLVLLTALLSACTYEQGEESMELQQRSASGFITPGTDKQVHFQLPYFLDPDGNKDPGSYVVQLSLQDPNPVASGYRIEAKAEITWSVSGNSIRRVVDCVNGMSISGVAEGVAVTIYDDSSIGVGSPEDYLVSLSVSKGNRASIQQPPFYTLPIDIIAPGGFIATDIPQDIGAISARVDIGPVDAGDPIGEFDLEVLQQYAGGTLKAYSPKTGWVPLAPATRQIAIAAAAALGDSAYFSIVLGIDG